MPLSRPISEILQELGRQWSPNPPADEDEIAELRACVPFDLPLEYIELLRYCDGGDGELNAPPLIFGMDSIAESVEHNERWRKDGCYKDFWFIGDNGGLETIGFDLRSGPPHSIITIDCIAGNDSAEPITTDISDLIQKIGISAPDE